MTRREFLKLLSFLSFAIFDNPFKVFSLPFPRGERFNFSYRKKGRVFKFHPPYGEVVRHKGFLHVENGNRFEAEI